MSLVVLKYGGSSLASPRHIRRAAEHIRCIRNSGKELVIVVSAMGKMTDMLIRLAHRVVQTPPEREMDMLLSAGERVSMSLLSMVLQELGVPAISFTGSQSGIVTTNEHTNARIIDVRAHRIQEELAKGKVVIIAGFQGVSEEKEITTLGRGGSDTTAVALAAALGAELCEILTDVEGVFTADPRLVPAATLIENCSYDEALELSHRGAKLHTRSVEVAKRFSVPVRVASSKNPSGKGTMISGKDRGFEKSVIRGIATKDALTYFRIEGDPKIINGVFEQEKAHCRLFHVGADSGSWLVDQDLAAGVRAALSRSKLNYEEHTKVAMVSIVGESIAESREVRNQFFETLEKTGTRVLGMSANSLSLCVAIDSRQRGNLARELHDRFLE